jgi:pyoverdine/dityrosine biosynthesis protein Dit1
MKNIQTDSLRSISSLHALEHFGLGRYGDPVDPIAHIKAINEIQRVSAPGANIYISVPIGIERLEFNAQRVFNAKNFSKYFDKCSLLEFSYIDDEEKLNQNASLEESSTLYYGCGLFHFIKSAN